MASEPAPILPARVPARTVLVSVVAVWLTYFALATLRSWLDGIGLFDALLERRVIVTLGSMAVTVLLWPLLRLLDPRPMWQKGLVVLVILLPASLLLAQLNQWVFADIENKFQTMAGEKQGLRIRSDKAGNLLVDPLESEKGLTPQANPSDLPPPVPLPSPHVATIAQQEQATITIDAAVRADNRWRGSIDLALTRYFVLLAWAALYFALVNAEQARAAERREGEFRRAAKTAELRSLRYQINPHFLFNTLNSLSALVLTGKSAAAEKMIQTLSTFYRRSLSDDPTGDVTLGEEIQLQQLYLEIESVRFPRRLRVVYDIPAALEDARVPGMILQPLVENSVKYAVASLSRAVTITIAAREEFERLVLSVSDDGPGKPAVAQAGGGIGLGNVRDRIAARFGDLGTFGSGPAEGGGWRNLIRLPLLRHD